MSDEMRQSEADFVAAKEAKQSVRQELKADLQRLDDVVRAMRTRVESLPEEDRAERLRRWWPWWDK